MAINMKKLMMQNKPLADIVAQAFTDEELAEMVAAKTGSGTFIGVGYIDENGTLQKPDNPDKLQVILELEQYMASR